jgi:hypothetical protein
MIIGELHMTDKEQTSYSEFMSTLINNRNERIMNINI